MIEYSKTTNQIPKYIFCVAINETNYFWKVVHAKELEIDENENHVFLRIKDIFGTIQ